MPTETAQASFPAAKARPSRKRSPLVSPANFVMATRDTGYRSTSLAVAEFVDNSLQAEATSIDIEVLKTDDKRYPIELRVIDNGSGMESAALSSALRFGGS